MDDSVRRRKITAAAAQFARAAAEFEVALELRKRREPCSVENWRGALWRAARQMVKATRPATDKRRTVSNEEIIDLLMDTGFGRDQFKRFMDGAS